MMKRQITALCLGIILCLNFSGCGIIFHPDRPAEKIPNTDSLTVKSPFDGKSLNEIALICLEKNYPEHDFSLDESRMSISDKELGRAGTFLDEKGRRISLEDWGYAGTEHFGCHDTYFVQWLKEQHFAEKADKIAGKYGCEMDLGTKTYRSLAETRPIMLYFNGKPANRIKRYDPAKLALTAPDTRKLAAMAKEMLNCVNTPLVREPEKIFYSTNEIDVFTQPSMSAIYLKFIFPGEKKKSQSGGIAMGHAYETSLRISFSEKEKSVAELEQEIKGFIRLHLEQEAGVKPEKLRDEAYTPFGGKRVKTSFGRYVMRPGWTFRKAGSDDVWQKAGAKDGDAKITIRTASMPYRVITEGTENAYAGAEHKFNESWRSEMTGHPGCVMQVGADTIGGVPRVWKDGWSIPDTKCYRKKAGAKSKWRKAWRIDLYYPDNAYVRSYYIMGDGRYCQITLSEKHYAPENRWALEQILNSFTVK
ncbi:hypothetical protein [Pseudoramibacter alactolyticus]|uniref:hypothetical protein n=1 Tax=Pseudoramibacter alactolyticus TaxID=113287 RepID=UPI00248E1FC6|nr:hypothetical protein [Pseudoramibacter alactolyticus]